MAMDALGSWIEEYKKLPNDTTGLIAPSRITAWIQQRSKGLTLSSVTFSPDPKFIWMGEIFMGLIAPICITPNLITNIPASLFATAWANSISASVNLFIQPAATFLPTNGTNGVVSEVTAIIDAASILQGTSAIYNKLASASFMDTTVFPTAFYEAFMSLTVTIIGLDTTPTPSGPIPISFPATPVN